MHINLDVPEYRLSCRLPFFFSISDVDGKRVEVQILINGKSIYETALAVDRNAEAHFYDLRSLVHEYMQNQSFTTGLLNIKARDDDSEEMLPDPVQVLFAKIDAPCEDDDRFLSCSFLTTRSFYMLPRTAATSLNYVLVAQERATPRISCVFSQGRSGDTTAYTFTLDPVENTKSVMEVYSLSISHDIIRSLACDRGHTTFEWLLSATITIGCRTFSIFFTTETPARIFRFRNAYNVEEYAFIFGKAKQKTVFSNKEASSCGVTSFYDRTKEITTEIETSALVPEEARWLNQLFDSHAAYTMATDFWQELVLFDGITSEISDADDEVIRLKFSYRYDYGTEYSPEIPENTGIFTREYNDPFI